VKKKKKTKTKEALLLLLFFGGGAQSMSYYLLQDPLDTDILSIGAQSANRVRQNEWPARRRGKGGPNASVADDGDSKSGTITKLVSLLSRFTIEKVQVARHRVGQNLLVAGHHEVVTIHRRSPCTEAHP